MSEEAHVSRRPGARRWATGGVLLFWVAAMGWLIRYEAFPGRFSEADMDYRALFQDVLPAGEFWTRLSFRDQAVGYSRTRFDTSEREPDARFLLYHQTFLQWPLLGRALDLRVTMEAALDDWRRLQRFSAAVRSEHVSFQVVGRRVGAGLFEVRSGEGETAPPVRVKIPDEAMLALPLAEYSLRRLEPGGRLRLRTLDPMTLKPSDLLIEAGNWTVLPGATNGVLALWVTAHGLRMPAWMDRDGRLVRQETPLGLRLDACEAAEALAWMSRRKTASRPADESVHGLSDILRSWLQQEP